MSGSLATYGYCVKPLMAASLSYGLEMGKRPPKRVLPTDLRDILASNVARLMKANTNLDTQTKLGAKAGVGQRTVGRVQKARGPTNVDTIQAIAEALGVAAWELFFDNKGKKVSALVHKGEKVDDDLRAVSDSWQYLTTDDRAEIRKTTSQRAAKNRRIASEITKPPTNSKIRNIGSARKKAS
jgi:transcriptional regulator with XRE-family HTH domain